MSKNFLKTSLLLLSITLNNTKIDAAAKITNEVTETEPEYITAAKNGDLHKLFRYPSNAKEEDQERIQKNIISALNTSDSIDVTKVDEYLQTPLHLVVLNSNFYELAIWLIEKGSDVNAQNKYGITPLMTAVFRANNNFLKILLDASCDLDKTDNDGVSALNQRPCLMIGESICSDFRQNIEKRHEENKELIKNEPQRRLDAKQRREDLLKIIKSSKLFPVVTVIKTYLPNDLREYREFQEPE